MKRYTALVACLCLVLQPVMALAETEPEPIAGADTRLYLADGSLVEGNLIEKAQDLVIMRVNDKIFTFDKTEIDKIITLESLGGGAHTISVTEFPTSVFSVEPSPLACSLGCNSTGLPTTKPKRPSTANTASFPAPKSSTTKPTAPASMVGPQPFSPPAASGSP